MCLSFRDNVGWLAKGRAQSGKATIRELFSLRLANRRRRRRSLFSFGQVWPWCNNQLANCLTVREHAAEQRVESRTRTLASPQRLYSLLGNVVWNGRFTFLSAVYSVDWTWCTFLFITPQCMNFPLCIHITQEATLSTAVYATRKVSWQSLSLFAVNYGAHLWLQWHWQLSKGVCVYVRLSVQKTERGPVRRLCIGLPVSTQSGPQRRICRPDRIRLPLFTQQWWG